MKKALVYLLLVAFVVGLFGYFLRAQIVMAIMPRVLAANMERDLVADQPDGLHAILCGAGSPLPDPNRSGPCVAVIAGNRVFVVDSGSGSGRVLQRIGVPFSYLDAVFLTHFHSDHIDGLGELEVMRWAAGGRKEPVPVYGPEGVQDVVDGINLAYRPSRASRVAHHGEEVITLDGAGGVAMPFPEPALGELLPVFSEGDLTVSAFRVNHFPVEPAVGYRFDYKDRSLVISGDTAQSANLEERAAGVDLLLHEALDAKVVARMAAVSQEAGDLRRTKILNDILDYHTTPVEAAESAQTAGVGHLLYYHVVPPLLLSPMELIFVEGVDEVYDGPVTVGRDGTLVRMESGSEEIEVEELL